MTDRTKRMLAKWLATYEGIKELHLELFEGTEKLHGRAWRKERKTGYDGPSKGQFVNRVVDGYVQQRTHILGVSISAFESAMLQMLASLIEVSEVLNLDEGRDIEDGMIEAGQRRLSDVVELRAIESDIKNITKGLTMRQVALRRAIADRIRDYDEDREGDQINAYLAECYAKREGNSLEEMLRSLGNHKSVLVPGSDGVN